MHGRKHKVPNELHVKAADNGGFIVRHSYDNIGAGESYQPPTEHAFKSHHDAQRHVKTQMTLMAGKEPDADDLGKDEGAERGSGTPRLPKVSGPPAHKAKAAAPTARTFGAGVD